jgi:hypothetical protein
MNHCGSALFSAANFFTFFVALVALNERICWTMVFLNRKSAA